MSDHDEMPANTPQSDAPAKPVDDPLTAPVTLNMPAMTIGSRRKRHLPSRNAVIAVLFVALFIAGVFADQNISYKPPPGPPDYVSGASPSNATSSAWYCPMTAAARATPDAGVIFALNPNESSLSGTVTYFSSGRQPVDAPVNIPAHSRIELRPADVIDAPLAAALLRFDGGGAAVEEAVVTPQSSAHAPCATQAAAQWYFAGGSTESGATLQFGMFNPFLEDTIADVSFVTNDGNVAPDEFQGVVIPARSFTSINVSDRVRRRDWIATTITARSGRLVASEMQTGLINGVAGSGLTLGATSTSPTWYLPDGNNAAGLSDQLSLFNPNDAEAEVDVSLLIDKGSVDPFRLHVPGHGRIALNYPQEPRVPADSSFGVVVRSTNGVHVVAQRTAVAGPPKNINGATMQMASPDTARRWIVPLNETRAPWDDWVYVINPQGVAANVKVTSVSPNGRIASSEGSVQPGRRLLIHVDEFAPDDSDPGLIIESDQDIVAGRTLSAVGVQGYTSSLAIPVR